MLSRSHGFLFVHIPKTGGNSVAQALLSYAEDRVVTPMTWQDGRQRFELENPGLSTTKHSPLHEYVELLGRDELDGLIVFATIRDPWSRLMSFYFSPHRGSPSWNRDDFLSLIDETPSMLSYLTYDGSEDVSSLDDLGADFVLRFENLATDFAELTGRLGIEAQLPELNQSTRPSLFELYDLALVDYVGERYRREIDLFGYSPPA